MISAAHEDAILSYNQTDKITLNVSSCDLQILSLFINKVEEADISSDFHFIIDTDCHEDQYFLW
jgi:hypothetical protein